jgi:hypothetical protein
VEDKYVLYVLVYKIPDHVFWYHPMASVDRIFESKQAYENWRNNPKTR